MTYVEAVKLLKKASRIDPSMREAIAVVFDTKLDELSVQEHRATTTALSTTSTETFVSASVLHRTQNLVRSIAGEVFNYGRSSK